jgi:hypothetical protein
MLIVVVTIGCNESETGSDGLRKSNNARLESLQLSVGDLDQIFQANSISYSGRVGYSVATIQLMAITEGETATLSVNGVPTNSGQMSQSIALVEGINTIEIKVTAENASNTLVYQLDLTRQSAETFAQQAYIKASNTQAGDIFGSSIDIDGDTLAVGAWLEDSNSTGVSGLQANNSSNSSGAVYVFTRLNGVWIQQAYLKASNTDRDDQFGFSVALSGDSLAVGAPGENSHATGVNHNEADNTENNSGAVYLFTRSLGVWSQQAYIKASNTEFGSEFGFSVSLDANTLAVGASGEKSNATGVNGDQDDRSADDAGAVYLFTRASEVWGQVAYLKASNTEAGDFFGHSVALSGDSLAVGAPGESSNAMGIGGDQADNSASVSGATYMFIRSAGNWSQQAYIKASNTQGSDNFGYNITLDQDTLAVGAHGEDSAATGVNGDQTDNTLNQAGAVYVFIRSAGVWNQEAYLKASNTNPLVLFGNAIGDAFGINVALSGDSLAIGAYLEDGNTTTINGLENNKLSNSGAAYLFTRVEGVWSQKYYIKASNPGVGDDFGSGLALDEESLVVAAKSEDSGATGVGGDQTDNASASAGAVYVYR